MTFRYAVTDAPATPGPTPWQTVGPFFHFALPYPAGPALAGAARPGRFQLTGQIFDGAGTPVPDALVEIWQADEQGQFTETAGVTAEVPVGGFRGFGRCATDTDGRYTFRTVKPAGVPTVDGRVQAPHLAVSILARGMLRRAVTRIYFADETTANTADPLLTSVDPDRRHTLLAVPGRDGYQLDIHLQGEAETVFLHVGV